MSAAPTEQSCRIVLIEDNPADVYLIRTALDEHGMLYDLQVVSDGRQCVSLIDCYRQGGTPKIPDLFVLDLNLPTHDGTAILRMIKETPALSKVPVAILTSSESPKEKAAAEALGADRFIRKPIELEEFLRIGGIFKTMCAEG